MNEQWERDNLRAKAYHLKAVLEDVIAELDTFADNEPTRQRLNALVEHAFSASNAAVGFGSFLRRQRATRSNTDIRLLAELERIARNGGSVDVRA